MSFTMQKLGSAGNKASDNLLTKHIRRIKVGCFMIAAVFLAGISATTAEAASGIKIYNYTTAKTTTYTGIQPKVTYNGTAIGSSATPGILVNGIALVPYDDIFQKSKLSAECTYNEKKNTVTIKKNGKTIVMTVGSKKATLNGSAVTLPVAPVKLKYVAAGKTKVLVPSRYVAEKLGLGYSWNSKTNVIAIKKDTLTLAYNGGAKFEYAGTKGKVTVDGEAVELGSMPSIITNNTAMLQAEAVFSDSEIAADYSYDETTKKVTLKKDDQTLVMTIGSKTASLNNKKVQLDAAPILVTNYEDNGTYVMVPGSVTATSLGYQYQWNSSAKTSVITTKKSSGGSSGNSAPELGDGKVIIEVGTVINEWPGNEAIYQKCSGIHELGVQGTYAAGSIESVVRDSGNAKMNAETYKISATQPFGNVTSKSLGNTITITAENLSCANQSYPVYGVSGSLVNTIATSTGGQGIGSAIVFETISGDYEYDLRLSEDRRLLYVTVYTNALVKATAGINAAGDYLTLEGLSPLKVDLNEQENLITLELPGTVNSLGEIGAAVSGMQFMNYVSIISANNKTQVVISLTGEYVYYFLENGNGYTISFQKVSAGSWDGGGSVMEGIPTVGDPSAYEIVIPRPEGLTADMVSHEDFYLSKYFVIRLLGDYGDFYNANSIDNSSNQVNNVTVSVKDNVTEIKVATRVIQGYELAWDSENIYINVGNPAEIYDNIVVLDPGHGGAAVGAQYYGANEKDINFKILYTIGKQYFDSDPSRLKVYYTRTADYDIPLNDRAAFAKQVGADLFVSLHANALKGSSASGTEVYYSKKNNSANSAGLNSQTLASRLQDNLVSSLSTVNRGVKSADFVVIYKNTVPAVLIELGFMSNKSELDRLTDEAFQTEAARIIYETLLQVFDEYPS